MARVEREVPKRIDRGDVLKECEKAAERCRLRVARARNFNQRDDEARWLRAETEIGELHRRLAALTAEERDG